MIGWQTILTERGTIVHHVERVLAARAQTTCGRIMLEAALNPEANGTRCRHCERLLERRRHGNARYATTENRRSV